ncbi:DUF4240 domain-containing protein [Rhodocytophaga rosea]|uniref:DUF4240 domain-containing protein n=1 Tax=Rhodocytophaga rosea TaxID=2704465 RepID=A0A6C0GUY9_9BACT|nr:DUF4240 domain-containing protein [Rhodocytophaga rosea]QHT71373.1 DUF4240 domain-containing protein [Rhodocytophaga rosea]
MNEQRFWKIIETAWQNLPLLDELRQQALQSNEASLFEGVSFGLNDEVVEEMESQLEKLTEQELTAFNHIMEEKLYTIDREEIHKYTDGSDDGFLYCRGFIVGMGEQYYNEVNENPARATMDVEAESVCFIGYDVYEKRFGKEFERNTTYNIESCSNANGWSSE